MRNCGSPRRTTRLDSNRFVLFDLRAETLVRVLRPMEPHERVNGQRHDHDKGEMRPHRARYTFRRQLYDVDQI